MSRPATISVYANWKGLSGPTLMGQLHRSIIRGEEVISFEYARAWLTQVRYALARALRAAGQERRRGVRGRRHLACGFLA